MAMTEDEALQEAAREWLPTKAERRRYALLQASTHLLAGLFGNDERLTDAVQLAEELLSEIEKRESELEAGR